MRTGLAQAVAAVVAAAAAAQVRLATASGSDLHDRAVRFTYICREDGGDVTDDSFGPCLYASTSVLEGTTQTHVYADMVKSSDLDGGDTEAELDREYGWKVYFNGTNSDLDVEIEHNYTDGGLDIGGKYHNKINIWNVTVNHNNGQALTLSLLGGSLPDDIAGPYQFYHTPESSPRCLSISDSSNVHIGNCSRAESKLKFVNFVAQTSAPSTGPTPAPTAGTITSPPTEAGTNSDTFTEKVILLRSSYNDRYNNGLLLGLGISSGSNPEVRPVSGDKLQLKSLVKNYFKDNDGLEEYKMLWDHDSNNRLSLTRSATDGELFVQSKKGFSSLSHNPIDKFGYVQLAEMNDHAKQRFTFVRKSTNANDEPVVKVIIGDDIGSVEGDFSSSDLCLTVASCDPWADDVCRPNSNRVGCETSCSDNWKTLEGIVNGSYVKLANCKSDYDESQLFVVTTTAAALQLLSDSVAPTTQPTTANPTTANPTTAPPTANPTAPPSQDERAVSPEDGENEPADRALTGLYGLLGLLVGALIIVVFVRRRRKQNRTYDKGFKDGAGGFYDDDDDDDDDDQELYNSFDTPIGSDGASSRGSDGISPSERRAKTSNSLEQPMINKRSNSMSFEPHVAHFEQEAGFVARV